MLNNIPFWSAIPRDYQALIGAVAIVWIVGAVQPISRYAIWVAVAIMAVWIANYNKG